VVVKQRGGIATWKLCGGANHKRREAHDLSMVACSQVNLKPNVSLDATLTALEEEFLQALLWMFNLITINIQH